MTAAPEHFPAPAPLVGMAESTWWEQIKGVFSKAEASTPNEPVSHEVLTRHKDRREGFARWREGIVARRMRDWLREAYEHYLRTGQPPSRAVDFLDTSSSKGFVIHFDELQYSREEAENFQLLLRERVLAPVPLPDGTAEKRYRTQVADARTYTKAGATERTDRYYLKPRLVLHEDPAIAAAPNGHTADQFGQGFGNVLIELVTRNEQPYRLRFSATIYHDRVYQKAEGFGALMGLVLGSAPAS